MRDYGITTLLCYHDHYEFQVDGARIIDTDYSSLLELFTEEKLNTFIMTNRIDILLYKLPQIDKVYRNAVHENLILGCIYDERIVFINYQNWHKSIGVSDNITNDEIENEVREIIRSHPSWRKFPMTPAGVVRKELRKLGIDYRWLNKLTFSNKQQYNLYNNLPRFGLIGYDDIRRFTTVIVNSYDIKSSYPYIMYNFGYPTSVGRVIENYPIDKFQELEDKLWVAEIEFAETPVLKLDGLDLLDKVVNKKMTLTSTDYEILKGEYDFTITNINSIMIHYFTRKLPDPIREFILNSFHHKESFPHNSNEYKEAKLNLNMIYGIFYRNSGEKIDSEFPIMIGAWTCAFGRSRIYEVLKQCRYNAVYWDTDGIKVDTDISDIIDKINQENKIEGIELGQWKLEKEDAEFIPFGKKQYWLDGELTCAGLNKKLANKYLKENHIIPYEGLVIPSDYTGLWHYDDNYNEIKLEYLLGGS